MQMKLNLLVLAALLIAVSGCSFAGNSEAVSLETVEPGVQKVTPLLDRNTFLPNENATAPWYRMYDDQTAKWYPAQQTASGDWELTREGQAMRKEDLESLAEPDEDKVTQWRNDTTGFTYSPQLIDTKATGQGMKAKPTPQLDLERKRSAAAEARSKQPEQPVQAQQVEQDELTEQTEQAEPAPLEAADEAMEASTDEAPLVEEVVEEGETATAETEPTEVAEAVDFSVEEPTVDSQEVAIPTDASTLTLEGRSPTWVSAVIDGGDQQDYFIQDGQTIDLFFGSSIALQVGDVPSVRMYLDGEPYTLSPDGKTTINRP